VTLCVFVDEYSVIVDMYICDLNVVLGLHTTYKVKKLSSNYLFGVGDVDLVMTAVVISVYDLMLLTVDAPRGYWSDNIDVYTMEEVR
jgi:hypothetical protein